MGPLLMLVSPCSRENVMSHAKLCLFCVVEIIFFPKLYFFFLKSYFKMALIWKRTIFDLLFTKSPGKRHKYFFCTYLYYIHTHILLTLLFFFCLSNFAKIANLSCMVSLWCNFWCWFLFTPFWSVQQITKWWAKFKLEWNVYYWYLFSGSKPVFLFVCLFVCFFFLHKTLGSNKYFTLLEYNFRFKKKPEIVFK